MVSSLSGLHRWPVLDPFDIGRRVAVLALAGDAEPDVPVAAADGVPDEARLAGCQRRQRHAAIGPHEAREARRN